MKEGSKHGKLLTYRLNKRGLKAHPCLTPQRIGKGSDKPFGVETDAEHLLYIDFNMLIIFVLMPIEVSRFNSLSCGMLSNAFVKSTKQQYNFLFCVVCLCMAESKMKTASVIRWFVRNPNLDGERMSLDSAQNESLLCSSWLKILPITFSNDIPQ